VSESLKQTKHLTKKTLATVCQQQCKELWQILEGKRDVPKQGQSPDLLTHSGRYGINIIEI